MKHASAIYKWQGEGGVELCDVLKAVFAIKQAGLLKERIAGLSKQDESAYDFCLFADKHFLSADVEKQLGSKATIDGQDKALVLANTDVMCSSAHLTGGKGSSLAVLNGIKGVTVPAFFCVTTHAFKQHFDQNKAAGRGLAELQKISDKFWADGNQDETMNLLFKKAEELRVLLEQEPLLPVISKAIREGYSKMPINPQTKHQVFVAVRSSATTEDTKDASFAGQHDTFLFQKNIEDIESTVRSCWASVFTDRAVEYRGRNKI